MWVHLLIDKVSLVGLFYVFQVLAYFAVLHDTTIGFVTISLRILNERDCRYKIINPINLEKNEECLLEKKSTLQQFGVNVLNE